MQTPYLLFLGDAAEFSAAKTAAGILQWKPEACLAQFRMPGCGVDLGLPDMSPAEAAAQGARTMVIGVVNVGGYIPDGWKTTILAALDAGLDVAAGMHERLADIPEIAERASKLDRTIFDVRQSSRRFKPGTGQRRAGNRLLTVGTDCAVGKKYTALAIDRAMRDRGLNSDFRATGQTGLLIAGRGVVIDAVIADFISGAAEWLSPAADPDHWDIIEGQGSLFHPAYAGVTLGLIHGSQPDALVVCHEPVRSHLLGLDYKVPDLRTCIDYNVSAARLTNPEARAVGISINTSRMDRSDIEATVKAIEDETGLACCDPLLHGAGKIVDVLVPVAGQFADNAAK
ncbi:N-acetyltransferase DgcN [Hyphomonas sp. NPDC076900]|uniref:N-acetyltransferase DgcN n=1 Tax=unclassified Hyphomonas TaxID=2630699 RepID=UPI003D0359DF